MKIKNILQYRIWYKPDGQTKDGFLEFEIFGDNNYILWIRMKKDHDCMYPISVLFDEEDHWIFDRPTGRLDKNLKMIYENDIVRFTTNKNGHFKGEVIYMDFGFRVVCGWENPREDQRKDRFIRAYMDGDSAYEIIGNKYQNADLLEQFEE